VNEIHETLTSLKREQRRTVSSHSIRMTSKKKETNKFLKLSRNHKYADTRCIKYCDSKKKEVEK